MRQVILGLASALGAFGPAQGQQFPNKEVSVIGPHAPGGATDLVFRALANSTRKYLGRALSGFEEPDAQLGWAQGLGARNVLLMCGAEGAIASDGARRERIAGRKVQAVDATGAGDCFCGATLARVAAGDSLFDAARYGNAAAALKTTGYGAVAPLPRAQEVRRLLDA
jgi:hypothetical protein